MGEIIKVGMADLKIAKAPDILTTLGLGSCIGLTLYDPAAKIGGLVHYMPSWRILWVMFHWTTSMRCILTF